MNEYLDLAPDWYLRTDCALHMLNDLCRCHIYTDNTKCNRCRTIEKIKEQWPTEWALACQAYAENKSRQEGGN